MKILSRNEFSQKTTGDENDKLSSDYYSNYAEYYNLIQKNRTLLLLIVLSFSLSGCSWILYDSFQKFDDEFKNSEKYIARAVLYPEESRTEINFANVVIEREVFSGRELTKAYFVISRTSSSFSIDKTGFLKAAGQSFEIKIAEAVTEYKSKNETTVTSYSRSDSTGVFTGQTTNTGEDAWITDKFYIVLTPEIVSSIKRSEEFFVRFYFGPVPATFKFRGSKLNPVHKALGS